MKKMGLLLLLIGAGLNIFAQNDDLINAHTAEKHWFLEPWLWIGSGILLLLIMLSVLFRLTKKISGNSENNVPVVSQEDPPIQENAQAIISDDNKDA